MKRSRPKVPASQSQHIEYELQRLQKLKFNAERMEARGSASVANKILEEKTKALICPSARQNSIPEIEDDDSVSEYDGENEVETDDIMEADNVTSGKRKANKQVSKQVKKSSLRPQTMADVVEVNSRKKHAVDEVQNIHSIEVSSVKNIQKKQRVISEKKGTKRVFCSPSSMSVYLEFRKRQKENNDGFVSSNQSLNNSLTRKARNNNGVAFNENNNEDADALSENDEADALNENDDDVGNEYEGDLELQDEGLLQFGSEGMQEPPDSQPEKATKSKRHRGPTMLPKVHARTRDECEVIVLNSLGQPIGPTHEIVQEFKQFLGTVARDSELAPLNYIKFPCLPTLDKMWEYVQEKYMVPEAGREWVMQAINGSWKAHKCLTKKNYFYAYPTDALRWFHKLDTISEPQFRELLQYWHSKEAEEISKINKDNRLILDDMHTMGRNSYAILRHELQQQDPDKKEPSQARVYKESRKRTEGRTYLTNHEKVAENIAKMDALESSQHEDGSNSKDPYSEVIPEPKRKSRVCLLGKGVKKSDLKKKENKSDFIFPAEFLENMQAQLV